MATTVAPPAASSAPPPSAPPTPPATSAPANLDAGLDSVFDRAESEASPGEPLPIAPEIITGDEPQAEVVDEEPAAAPPVTAAVEPEDIDPYAEIEADSVSNDGKTLHFKKAKADRLLEAQRTLQAIREIDPFITPEGIADMRHRTLELDRMLNAFDTEDVQGITAAAMDFAGPGQKPQSVAVFVDQAVASAAQHHPAAFKVVQDNILRLLSNQQFAKFQQTGNEDDRLLAWNLDYLAHGKQGDYKRYDAPAQPNGRRPDPVDARLAEIIHRDQQYNFRANQDRKAMVDRAVGAADTERTSAVDKAIESALSLIPEKVREQRAVDYRHAVRDLRDEFEKVTKASDPYQKQHAILMNQLRANPSDQTRNAVVAFDKQWAEYVAGRSKREILGRFNETVLAQTNAAQKKQEALRQRIEPGGGSGTPVQRTTLKQALSDPKTGFDKGIEMYFEALAKR